MMNASVIGKANAAISADRTSSGKEHFEVLDGLRGSAAFLIVSFHLFRETLHLARQSVTAKGIIDVTLRTRSPQESQRFVTLVDSSPPSLPF